MDPINETAYPRVGLVGNPSDLYGGRGVGFSFDAWSASVALEPAERLDLGQSLAQGKPAPAALVALLSAGWDVFREHAGDVAEPDPLLGTVHAEPGAGSLRWDQAASDPFARAAPAHADDGAGLAADGHVAESADAAADAGEPHSADAAGATHGAALVLRRDGLPWLRLRPFRVRVHTVIPRQAGLAGSSAILIALLRGLARGAGLQVPPQRLAQLAWRAEVEGLGIRAGPLDRLVQAHEGLLAMDFARPWDPSATRRLDPSGLPPMGLVVDPRPGRPSGDVHAPLFARWLAGDAEIDECLQAWRVLADAACVALERGEAGTLAQIVCANLAVRARLFDVTPGDRRVLDEARAHGVAAKLCGSGGAVLCVSADADPLEELLDSMRAADYRVTRPALVGPLPARGNLRAVVLAAGFATRLYPLTRTCAKPLLELGGVPLLTRLLRQLAATDVVHDVVVVTNARFHADFEAWRDALLRSSEHADRGLPPIVLVCDGVADDGANLGAIADLQLALAQAPPPPQPLDGYLVLAGDNLLDVSFEPFTRRFLERGCSQLVVRRLPEPVPPARYAEIQLAEDGALARFREKPAAPSTPLSALPLYLLTPDLPELVDEYLARPDADVDAPGWLLAWLCERRRFEVLPVGGRWFDVGDLQQLEAARAWLAARDGSDDTRATTPAEPREPTPP